MGKYNFKVSSSFTANPERLAAIDALNKFKADILGKEKYEAIFRDHLKSLEKRVDAHQDEWVVRVELGKHAYLAGLDSEPTAEDIEEIKEMLKADLRKSRESAAAIEQEDKSIMGFKYSTIGGVFTTSGAIKALQGTQNSYARIRERKIPHPMFKTNFVGVELEFFCKQRRGDLEKILADAGLASFANVKEDVSIKPTDARPYGHEVTLLCKEEFLVATLTKLCGVLKSPLVDADVNESCGLHVHLDMRNRSHETAYFNFVKALPLLNKLIPKTRINNRYCRTNTDETYEQFMRNDNQDYRRRQAVNGEAYSKYKTIEIRMHSGSLNSTKIINWCLLLANIAAVPTKISSPISTVAELQAKVATVRPSLANYLTQRMIQLGNITTTEEDSVDATVFEVAV